MSPRSLIFLTIALCTALLAGESEDKTLSKVEKTPDGLSPQIAPLLNPEGFAIKGPEAVCDVWVVKDLAAKDGFKPTLNVKYPFQPGQLIGALRVSGKTEFTDFRGQPVKAGVYTLRYGQQPQDGNHIGTSELSDFLLAIPATTDTDPKPYAPVEKLHKASAKSTGGNHPAIFSLLPAETAVTAANLAKDDNNRWVLGVPVHGTQGGKKVSLSLRLIVIGKAEG